MFCFKKIIWHLYDLEDAETLQFQSLIQKYQAQKHLFPQVEREVRNRNPFAVNLLLSLATQLLQEITKPRHVTNTILITDATSCARKWCWFWKQYKSSRLLCLYLSLKRICLLLCLQNSSDITWASAHGLAKRTLSDFQEKQMEIQKACIWLVTSSSATWAAWESSGHSLFHFASYIIN